MSGVFSLSHTHARTHTKLRPSIWHVFNSRDVRSSHVYLYRRTSAAISGERAEQDALVCHVAPALSPARSSNPAVLLHQQSAGLQRCVRVCTCFCVRVCVSLRHLVACGLWRHSLPPSAAACFLPLSLPKATVKSARMCSSLNGHQGSSCPLTSTLKMFIFTAEIMVQRCQ